MQKNYLSVREIEEKDIPLIADYWYGADAVYLKGMGVDTAKMPSRQNFETMLAAQACLSYAEKKAYALIWEAGGSAIGHCNLNPVVYGHSASMHLHIWKSGDRNRGFGADLIRLSMPYFFENMQLQKIYCEPYALNPSPNRMLEKVGFKFVKEYITTPGLITFEQPVNRWELPKP